MLSSTKSRRILHAISVTLALLVFSYGLFLKYTKDETVPDGNGLDKQELVKNEHNSPVELKEDLKTAVPN
ncbi:MAG: hypothetical protein HWE21_02300 [Cytophagia bacterium]|nr:hypothetical protein [Cytophagia bacterium]